MVRCSRGRSQAALGLLVVMYLIGTGLAAWGQTPDALGYSVATNYLVTKGFSGQDAVTAANGYVYQQLQRQVSFLSYMDCFRVISWLTLAVVPLLFLIRRFKPAGKSPAAH